MKRFISLIFLNYKNMSKNLRELEQLQQKLEYQNETLKVFIADTKAFLSASLKFSTNLISSLL